MTLAGKNGIDELWQHRSEHCQKLDLQSSNGRSAIQQLTLSGLPSILKGNLIALRQTVVIILGPTCLRKQTSTMTSHAVTRISLQECYSLSGHSGGSMAVAGTRSQSSDGSWFCSVAVAVMRSHGSGPPPRLLMHWSCQESAGAKWQAPPSGWSTQPPVSHDAGGCFTRVKPSALYLFIPFQRGFDVLICLPASSKPLHCSLSLVVNQLSSVNRLMYIDYGRPGPQSSPLNTSERYKDGGDTFHVHNLSPLHPVQHKRCHTSTSVERTMHGRQSSMAWNVHIQDVRGSSSFRCPLKLW